MTKKKQNIHRTRVNFSKNPAPIDPPSLLSIQTDSFDRFLQKNIDPEKREDHGLESVFRSVFPISDFSENCRLEYLSYSLGEPKYDPKECKINGSTYATPVRVNLRLINWDREDVNQNKKIYDIKEQEIYFGEFPLMTSTGSFIINGTERVIVSQLHKSPGVFFSHDKGKTLANGQIIHFGGIIPQRGAWVDFEFDAKGLMYFRIDRKKKIYATVLLKALELNPSDILDQFYKSETFDLTNALGKTENEQKFSKFVDQDVLLNQKSFGDILHPETGEVILGENRKISKLHLRKIIEADVKKIPSTLDDLINRVSLEEKIDDEGEVIVNENQMITKEVLDKLLKNNVDTIKVIYIGHKTIGLSLRDTLAADKITTIDESLIEIFKKMKPNEVATLEAAKTYFDSLFFNPERYDISRVGRMKLNKKLDIDRDLDDRVLHKDDFLKVVDYLLHLREGIGNADDIDHLGNRRVRSVGELLEIRYRIGLVRMERSIKERMSLQEVGTIMLHDIINAKPIIAVMNEFFGSSQLSQFMDQTNPLAEITHKRRLSALGPGGLSRDRAGFEVRDVHVSHYGRICPVETPEGPNIGLISSLSCHARLNEFGFIETPYKRVENKKIQDDIIYLSALDDDKYSIAQANATLDENNCFTEQFISAREGGEFKVKPSDEITLVDLSPQQLVSVAASMIPFLDHDDANRALMGSNMQRQAVPLIVPDAPIVGTGMEFQVARDSGSCLVAKRSGIVEEIDASRIVIVADVDLTEENKFIDRNVDIYHLDKYQRSNQNTSLNQRILVKKGQRIEEGQIIADGACSESGELALGQNIHVAFMPWRGYNYEDSIIVSENLLINDRFTSVHIEEQELFARDTKLGKEIITRDIPNVSEETLKNLDSCGIIRIGSYVKSGDILVGKITPKGESQLNPEEKLLRAIFGDKAGDVKDSSLRVPQAISGVITDVKIFNRRGFDKDERGQEIDSIAVQKIEHDYHSEITIIKRNAINKIYPLLKGQKIALDIVDPLTHETIIAAGSVLTEEDMVHLPEGSWQDLKISTKKDKDVSIIAKNTLSQFELTRNIYEQRIESRNRITDLPPGVITVVKVYIAIKRKLSVGDKMAGRHGNKGVISKIVPANDMPYHEDGTPIDLILNPLGVPSRMNVGQILELHLGWVAKKLGQKIDAMISEAQPKEELKKFVKKVYNSKYVDDHIDSLDDEGLREFYERLRNGVYMMTPVFDGASEEEIHRLMDMCGIDKTGKVQLYDGRTGDPFERQIAVGYKYILKLNHLVDEKIHARSTGPYSLVTQQPLGGKAQFGGQRCGEMEVWALKAHGAAYTLKEILTCKSDDVNGRNLIYESIVKGKNDSETGIPESFKVLHNEMKALCLELKMIKDTRYLEEMI